MTLEADLREVLGGVACGRAYADAMPSKPTFPLITYQVVGGRDFDYYEQKVPDREHVRLQVWVWATGRSEANQIMREARRALVEGQLMAETYGSPIWQSNAEIGIKGSRQDFGIWHKPDPY